MGQYAKAIVALIVPLVVTGVLGYLETIGVNPDTSLKDALTALLTAGSVWFVPNKK